MVKLKSVSCLLVLQYFLLPLLIEAQDKFFLSTFARLEPHINICLFIYFSDTLTFIIVLKLNYINILSSNHIIYSTNTHHQLPINSPGELNVWRQTIDLPK